MAKNDGADINGILQGLSGQVLVEHNRRSLASVICGLNTWQEFAVEFRNYNADMTLPPKQAGDVVAYISM